MVKKYIKFYSFSGLIVVVLLSLFFNKMNSTYEAKNNFVLFNSISQEYTKNKGHIKINMESLKLKNKNNINVYLENTSLKISIEKNDYRTCLKYGIDYIDSDFTSILINETLFTRSDAIIRDKILDKCSKNFNNITLTQTKDRRWK